MTRFGLCEKCANRRKCPNKEKHTSVCNKLNREKGEMIYRFDEVASERLKSINAREVERFFAKLEHTNRDQVSAGVTGRVVYFSKPCDVRRENSRGNLTVEISDDGLELMRYCENCGAEFHTTERTRRLCDACHDEICEYLCVNYSHIPPYTSGRCRCESKDLDD